MWNEHDLKLLHQILLRRHALVFCQITYREIVFHTCSGMVSPFYGFLYVDSSPFSGTKILGVEVYTAIIFPAVPTDSHKGTTTTATFMTYVTMTTVA